MGIVGLNRIASAQTLSTGGIAGVARDSTGAVLPGVTVEAASPALLEKVRTAITDNQGNYKILDLQPGPYSVTFTLQGFSTTRREGLDLIPGATLSVNVELRPGAIEETLTVSRAAPVVDVQNTRTQNVLSRPLIDALPTGKTVGAWAALTLGAVASATAPAQDVGGNRGELSTFLSVHGSRGDDQKLLRDGMITSLGEGSSRLMVTSQMATDEVVLETRGANAETQTAGVQINYVPREGGNLFKVYVDTAFSNGSLQGTNLSSALRESGLTETAKIKNIYDAGLGVGGRIIRDRLWFWVSYQDWGSSTYVPGNYFNKTPKSLFYVPDLSRPAYYEFWNREATVRFTWQIAEKHKLSILESVQDMCFCYSRTDTNISPEFGMNQTYPGDILQTTWSFPASNTLLFDAGVSIQNNSRNSQPPLGLDGPTIPITELTTGYRYGCCAAAAGYHGPEVSTLDQTAGRASATFISGSHALKVGTTWLQAKHYNPSYYMSDPPVGYSFRNQIPVSLTLNALPSQTRSETFGYGVYAQDQWTVKRVTLNLGVRFDHFWGLSPAQTRPAGYFTPRMEFAEVRDIPNVKDLNPRVGIVYDLFGDGTTAIKGSLGRFVQAGSPATALNNPASTIVGSTTRTWTDRNGNYEPDCDLRIPDTNGECGPIANRAFGTPVINTRYSPDLLTGWGVREFSWVGNIAFERELNSNLAFTAGYYHTRYGNFTITDNVRVTTADYDPYCITIPLDARLPGAGTPLCGLFDIKRASFGQVDYVVTAAPEMTETYNGFDVTMRLRFGEGGQVSAGLSTGQTVKVCQVVDMAPQFCETTLPFRGQTQVKATGVYPLPWWGLQVSGTLQNLPGIETVASYAATNAEIAPSLGRNLSQCQTDTGPCSATVIVNNLFEPFSQFEDRLTQVDFRLSKKFSTGRVEIRANADVYNVLNASTVLTMNTRYGSTWLLPSAVLGARIFKMGVQVRY